MGRRAKTDFFEPLIGVRIWRRRKGYDFVCPTPAQAPSLQRLSYGRAPDFVEPTVAWRVWRVIRYHDVHLLASPMINVVWPSRAALEASCLQWAGGRHDAPPPYERCSCGIYGTRLETLPVSMLGQQLLRPLVVGPVYLWGRVVEGEAGWRAERAYPKSLYIPFVGDGPSDRQLRLAGALAHYGVPVQTVSVPSLSEVAEALETAEEPLLGRAA